MGFLFYCFLQQIALFAVTENLEVGKQHQVAHDGPIYNIKWSMVEQALKLSPILIPQTKCTPPLIPHRL